MADVTIDDTAQPGEGMDGRDVGVDDTALLKELDRTPGTVGYLSYALAAPRTEIVEAVRRLYEQRYIDTLDDSILRGIVPIGRRVLPPAEADRVTGPDSMFKLTTKGYLRLHPFFSGREE